MSPGHIRPNSGHIVRSSIICWVHWNASYENLKGWPILVVIHCREAKVNFSHVNGQAFLLASVYNCCVSDFLSVIVKQKCFFFVNRRNYVTFHFDFMQKNWRGVPLITKFLIDLKLEELCLCLKRDFFESDIVICSSAIQRCSVERLSRLSQLQLEMAAQERMIDQYIDLLKTDRLDENTSSANLEKGITYFQVWLHVFFCCERLWKTLKVVAKLLRIMT